ENSARSAVVNIPPGPLIISGVTLKELIMYASGAPGFEVAGGRQWVSTARWNFRVETEPVIMPTEQYQQVLWRVLEDRFQLSAHRENKVMPIYEMTVASTGSKLRPDPDLDARGPLIRDGIGSIHLRNSSLEAFAHRLSL